MKSLTSVATALLLWSCSHSAAGHSGNSNESTPPGAPCNSTETATPDDTLTWISFAFMGDIMMGTTFPDSINGSHLPPAGGKHLFDDVRQVIGDADIAGGNLEGSFLEGPGQRRKMRNPDTYYIFRMPPKYVGNLVDAGFDFVGIANNHINDFGSPGRKSTLETLRKADIPAVGLKGVCETAILDRKGLRIGVTQFGHGANNLDVTNLDELRRVVKGLREETDIVVVSFHGGAEGKDQTHVPHKLETFVGENRGNVEAFAHAAIDAGADIVFGHGPHVPRAAELYRDRIIFYSLGNFCTPYRVSITGVSGYAPLAEVRVDAKGRFLQGRIHSFIQQRGKGPRRDPENSAARLIKRLSCEDFPSSTLVISDNGHIVPAKK